MDLSLPEISNAGGTWSILAVVNTSDGALILGEQYAHNGTMVLHYVVAFVPLVSTSDDYYADQWVNGRYFDAGRTRDNREAARAHFLSRVSDSLWS